MPASDLHIQTPDEAETVFYEAFKHGDIDVMSALWADDKVICVHPGSGLIRGHDAVVRSWRHIIEAGQPDIRYTATNKFVTDALAVHVVVEEIMNNDVVMAVVVSTNVYRKYEQTWLMVEHHGSMIQQERQNVTLQ